MAKATNQVEVSEFSATLDEHIRAGYQVMYINTSEESRVESEITRVAANMNMDVITWDCFEGFSLETMKKDIKFRSPPVALETIVDENAFNGTKTIDHIFVFRDLDDFMVDPGVRRRIQSLSEGNRLVNKKFRRPLIILSSTLNIHPKLKSKMSVIEFQLPGEERLKRQIEFVRQSIASKDETKAQLSEDLRETLAVNLLGLTSNEAENCLSRCIVRHAGFKPEMLTTIKEEKAAIVKKSEVLTYIPEDSIHDRSEIGGFDLYMSWLDRRKLAYTHKAREHHIDPPKGAILIGLPGTGKSMVAKATCHILGLPGYVLDIGSLFGSLVGESETRTRDALRQIDAQKGCVLVLDEADKALGNAHNSSGDSGVTKRVFGTILTWLAESKGRTFTIMTLNRITGLPPEILRAGRFDGMFFTDLPNESERRQILEIHLRRRHVDPAILGFKDSDWAEIMNSTKGFVGAELEEVVRESRYRSYEAHETGIPTFDQFIEAANTIVPLTRTDPSGMEEIRAFCKDKARPVTSPPVKASGRTSRVINVDN